MTTPQGRPDQPGPADPFNPTQAFASPGQVPPGSPGSGSPSGPQPQGPQPQGPPPQGPSGQGFPPQGPPSQGFPNQGPSNQGPPSQGFPTQGPPNQGPPGRPFQGPPQGGPPQGGPFAGPPQGGPFPGPPQGVPGPGPGGDGPWGPFGRPNHVGAARPQSANAIWALGLLSLVAVVCGLSISEDGKNAWETVHAWGALAILGSLLTLATVVAAGNLGVTRAWQVAACGAGALVLFWVLFVLPGVGSNTSLVTTIGVAAGAVAVWIAPGREGGASRPADGGATEHTW